jgi:hypothetical protein
VFRQTLQGARLQGSVEITAYWKKGGAYGKSKPKVGIIGAEKDEARAFASEVAKTFVDVSAKSRKEPIKTPIFSP